MAGTVSTLFSKKLFLRQLKFGGNWLHIIFQQIVLEAAQIWQELAPHHFPADCFGNLEGTGSTLFSVGLFWRQLRFGGSWLHNIFQQIFWRQLKFGGNWLHIIFKQIVLEAAQILEGTGSSLFSGGLFWEFGGNWLHIIFRRIVLVAA